MPKIAPTAPLPFCTDTAPNLHLFSHASTFHQIQTPDKTYHSSSFNLKSNSFLSLSTRHVDNRGKVVYVVEYGSGSCHGSRIRRPPSSFSAGTHVCSYLPSPTRYTR